MISDEDLQDIASVDDWYMGVHLGDMAKELLALRKAREGWKLVPSNPTNEMMWAAKNALSSTVGWNSFKEAYYGMLAAAPEPE